MAMDGDILFSIVTPSTGNRPNALRIAVDSVERAARFAGLEGRQMEILIGFDGTRGTAPKCAYPVRTFNLPRDRNRGNGVRDTLLKLAGGEKILFLDDDNMLKPGALDLYLRHFDAEMVIGRIDTQLTLDRPLLPDFDSGPLMRPDNLDLLCLCLSRRLVMDRCGGWRHHGEPGSAFLNMRDWHRGARSVTILEEVVGIHDAGRSLDSSALSPRQRMFLDGLIARRDAPLTPPAVFGARTGPVAV